MERVPHGDRLESAGGHSRQFQGHANGSRPCGGKQDLFEITWCQLREFFCQFDGWNVSVAASTKWQCLHLLLDCSNYLGIAKAHLVGAIAMEVHVTPTLEVFDIDPITTCEHVQARG